MHEKLKFMRARFLHHCWWTFAYEWGNLHAAIGRVMKLTACSANANLPTAIKICFVLPERAHNESVSLRMNETFLIYFLQSQQYCCCSPFRSTSEFAVRPRHRTHPALFGNLLKRFCCGTSETLRGKFVMDFALNLEHKKEKVGK